MGGQEPTMDRGEHERGTHVDEERPKEQEEDEEEGTKKEKAVVEKDEEEQVAAAAVSVPVHPPKDQTPISRLQVFPDPLQSTATQNRHIPPLILPSQPPIIDNLQQPIIGNPQPPIIGNLNPRGHTNRISLLLFLLHLCMALAAVGFFSYKAVIGALGDMGITKQRKERHHLSFWFPPIEGSAVLAILLAFAWQKALRAWPHATVTFALWFSFFANMAAGVLLLCFSLPATDGLGVALIAFSIGNGLYACWATRRTKFAGDILSKSLRPVPRFGDLNHPTYMMLATGFLWISLWCFAVIGALNFSSPPLTILAMVLSLMWTAEVIRNVANLTVSRAIALYYLRGMQSNTKFCFQRVVTRNLGSACLGSLFVPAIEACRILARGLNLLEGEDEFMFSCAHCCLSVMNAVFRFGNSWAFVHIAAYGRGFVQASQTTWALFEQAGMVPIVDADITSSVCFLSGVSSGATCVIFASSWTFSSHKEYTATVSLLAFFVGYLMTRIGMALPQACVGCYYVCYAENPTPRLFDTTIQDRIAYIASGRDAAAPTPRFPRRFSS